MTKKELRLKYKAMRSALSENDISEITMAIANKIISLPIWDKNYFHVLFLLLN